MEQKMNDFESLAQKAYARFGELAKRYYYKFKRPVVTDGGTPCGDSDTYAGFGGLDSYSGAGPTVRVLD